MELGGSYLFGPNIYLNGAIYLNRISDLIAEVPNIKPELAGTIHFENVGKMRIYGYQFELRARASETMSWYTHISGAINELKDENGSFEQFGDISPFQIGAGMTHRSFNDELTSHLHAEFVSHRKTVNWNEDESNGAVVRSIDPYWNLGVTLSWLISSEPGKLKLVLKGDNILNAKYHHPGIRDASGTSLKARIEQPGANYLLMLKMDF